MSKAKSFNVSNKFFTVPVDSEKSMDDWEGYVEELNNLQPIIPHPKDEKLHSEDIQLEKPKSQSEELNVKSTLKNKKRGPGRPKRKDLVRDNAAQKGLSKDYTRKTFIINVDLLNKLENYAYTERLSIKEAINILLEESLKDKNIIKKKK